MFTFVPTDIIFLIICNLTNIYDVINLSSIDKETYRLFDDSLYLHWGRNLYTKDFWDKAEQRTPITYKPYTNMKTELMRIEVFQNHLIKHGMEMWNKEDFYNYWEGLEKSRGKPPTTPTCCRKGYMGRGVPPAIPLAVGGVWVPPAIPLAVGGVGVPPTNEEIYAALDIL